MDIAFSIFVSVNFRNMNLIRQWQSNVVITCREENNMQEIAAALSILKSSSLYFAL